MGEYNVQLHCYNDCGICRHCAQTLWVSIAYNYTAVMTVVSVGSVPRHCGEYNVQLHCYNIQYTLWYTSAICLDILDESNVQLHCCTAVMTVLSVGGVVIHRG